MAIYVKGTISPPTEMNYLVLWVEFSENDHEIAGFLEPYYRKDIGALKFLHEHKDFPRAICFKTSMELRNFTNALRKANLVIPRLSVGFCFGKHYQDPKLDYNFCSVDPKMLPACESTRKYVNMTAADLSCDFYGDSFIALHESISANSSVAVKLEHNFLLSFTKY